MSREIKFRAWSDVEHHMLSMREMWSFKFEEIEQMEKLDYHLMQYTDLKDCKGNEIYEGDIVRIKRPLWDVGPDNAPMVEHLVEIKWVEATCGFRDAVAVTDGEVIGNIYDNPELLEQAA